MRGAYLMQLGVVPYREAWDLQRALAGRFLRDLHERLETWAEADYQP